MPIKVFIADDQNLVRKGLKQLLENELDVIVVGEAGNVSDCFKQMSDSSPNILILDSKINVNGITDFILLLRQNKINSKVLLLAEDDNNDDLDVALNIGCEGYILKDCHVDELREAIINLYNGDSYVQLSLRNNNRIISNSSHDKISDLSNREIEVLKLIAKGLFNKEIAEILCISERTVKNHVSSIFKKIQVIDRTQAAVFAIKNKLINV